SFAYPSQIWQRSSIPLAAEDLRIWLQTEFGDHRHILFVTHSTGGLVVKQMLKRAYQEIKTQLDNGAFDSSSSLWLRTRHVINIAVPHSGGSPFITAFAKITYHSVFPLMSPFLKLARFVTQGQKDWGWNDILITLRWQNPWLLELEAEFLEHQKASNERDLPYPMVHDIYAKSDLSVPIATDPNQRDLCFRGTHKSVKVPRQASDPVVAIVAQFVGRYGSDIGLTVTSISLDRIAEVNKVTSIKSLISQGESAQNKPPPSLETAFSGTQTEIRDAALARIHAGGERPRQMVITGAAGVGKSLVVRMIAWRLGREYLSSGLNNRPLPLFIPLQQVTLTDLTEDLDLWSILWRWWVNWAHSLYPLPENNMDWLESTMQTTPVTVFLDGVDDFLVNHPTIGLSTVTTMLRQAANRYRSNSRLSFIVAIRAGFPGLQRLADDPKDIFEVLRLSEAQAERFFPACKAWLPDIDDRELVNLMLTPLILSNYEPERDAALASNSLTRCSVLGQTIRTIIRRSNLIGVRAKATRVVEIDHLVYALTLIAWLFFRKSRGEISTEVLQTEARDVSKQWEAFFAQHGAGSDVQDIIMGFRLAADPETCNALLQRTVFLATGPEKVRFSHRHWQEFLLAQYFALCLEWGHVEDFGVTAFNSHIYRMAGELFQGREISEQRMQAVLNSWARSRNTYITGNLIAFLAWTQTAIDARAIRLLLGELPNFEALSRVVLIAGLGYRILVDQNNDHARVDLRRAFVPMLREFSNPATAPVDDAVASSLAWCYQKAFAEKFGIPQPEVPWPAIGFDDTETAKALPMICTVKDAELILDARSRSLQLAFLVPILDAYDDPNLAIRALHYLYYLVVARKHGAHVMELAQELPPILASGGEFERVIQSFTLVPEALTLYTRCQATHRLLESAAL
ncbi:MAG: NACHT domain-containing protein, partial [Gammaproteobacteria bacterium]